MDRTNQYFQDRTELILNRVPYNSNFCPELIKIRGPNMKYIDFYIKSRTSIPSGGVIVFKGRRISAWK